MERKYFAVWLVACLAVAACEEIVSIEKSRVSSPDGTLDAIFVEWPTNATSDFAYGVVLVKHGEKVSKDADSVVSGSGLVQRGIHWLNNTTLQVDYAPKSKIYSFKNTWYMPDAEKAPREIEIILSRTAM